MKIAVLKESAPHENRVAISPDTVKKFVQLGIQVYIEKDAGIKAAISNEEYATSGATISNIPLEIIADADVILKVQPSIQESGDKLNENSLMKKNAIIIGLLAPYENRNLIGSYANKDITSFALEFIPRSTRAQSMDVLSSQANLVGYRAVLEAAYASGKVIPMMMTAAGTITPAKVLVLGAGVAGLQAIATAKRLGAVVSAFDVRSAAKEQVESLGAKFIRVAEDENEDKNAVYAKEMSDEYKKKQNDLITETIKSQDIIITTALIPGKKAPVLVTKEMVDGMKKGSIIIDLAASHGGNCELTQKDEIVEHHGVKIIGRSNFASMLAPDTSRLYARNIYNFIEHLYDKNTKQCNINLTDDIIKNSLVTYQGAIVNQTLKDIYYGK